MLRRRRLPQNLLREGVSRKIFRRRRPQVRCEGSVSKGAPTSSSCLNLYLRGCREGCSDIVVLLKSYVKECREKCSAWRRPQNQLECIINSRWAMLSLKLSRNRYREVNRSSAPFAARARDTGRSAAQLDRWTVLAQSSIDRSTRTFVSSVVISDFWSFFYAQHNNSFFFFFSPNPLAACRKCCPRLYAAFTFPQMSPDIVFYIHLICVPFTRNYTVSLSVVFSLAFPWKRP